MNMQQIFALIVPGAMAVGLAIAAPALALADGNPDGWKEPVKTTRAPVKSTLVNPHRCPPVVRHINGKVVTTPGRCIKPKPPAKSEPVQVQIKVVPAKGQSVNVNPPAKTQ